MTDAETAPPRKGMNPWLAGLLGVVIVMLLTSFLDWVAHPGIVALALLIATAVGGFVAARLSGRPGPAWGTALFSLLTAIAYLFVHDADPAMLPAGFAAARQIDVPLWLAASVLGSPLLGARLGEAGARRR